MHVKRRHIEMKVLRQIRLPRRERERERERERVRESEDREREREEERGEAVFKYEAHRHSDSIWYKKIRDAVLNMALEDLETEYISCTAAVKQ
jgi:hypothetical protein